MINILSIMMSKEIKLVIMIHAYQTKLLLLCLEIIIGINRKCLKEQVKQLLLY